jgi:hypothetical protein
VGLLDSLLGRTKPVQANLDHLFGLPGAQITLEATESIVPTGKAGVCFKPAVGQAFAATETEFEGLLSLGEDTDGEIHITKDADSFGYRWIVVTSSDFNSLVTRVHLVNMTLQEHGYDQQLLCSVFGFAPKGSKASSFLVYLYKRGTFYPFVPTGAERRDNEAEMRLSAELGDDLAIEKELDRWFPLWDLPVD